MAQVNMNWNVNGQFTNKGSDGSGLTINTQLTDSSDVSIFKINNDGSVSFKNYSLPLADGSTGYTITTNGTGTLSFVDRFADFRTKRQVATISANTITTELNGNSYTVTVSSDVTTWNIPLPSGGVAADYEYGCRIDFLPPVAGGPFVVAIPVAWKQLGPNDAISLSSGEQPFVCILTTFADGTIGFTLQRAI